jgi:RHS repeat-associated protein
MSDKSGVSGQAVSLPSGGGGFEGTGGSFSPNEQTGAGRYELPIDVPTGRNEHTPELSLTYSSGNSNGPMGIGWTLGVGSVSRKTDDGVPTYTADDTFVLGSEDLIETDRHGGDEGTEVTTYRPRTDTEFRRIERHLGPTTDHWEVRTRDGGVRVFGTPDSRGDDPAVVRDPTDPDRVYSWRLTEKHDAHGNRIRYEYRRDEGERFDQLYVDRIAYVEYETNGTTEDLIEVAFEYEPRPDTFSRHRAGFERRTRERCCRIVVSTNAERGRAIRSYDLSYRDERTAAPANGSSQLVRVDAVGHADGATQQLPPVEFDYAELDVSDRSFEPVDGDVPRRPLSEPALELADLDGNGLPDIVEIDRTVRYWRNLGDGTFDDPEPMEGAPGGLSLADDDVQLMDADGDGRVDLVSADAPAGYFPLQRGGWDVEGFEPYETTPSVRFDAPSVELIDLTGDGVTDALHTGSRFECFFQDRERGWEDTRSVARGDRQSFPNVDVADERVRIADCSGDGLQDVVLVDDGHAVYWPNQGHGDWGPRVQMTDVPGFPGQYDPRRLLVGDVDGDGLADLVYVQDDAVTLWINQSGNGFGDAITIEGTPSMVDPDAVRMVDLYGTGVGGLLWSGGDRDAMYFLDFAGGEKPYLLTETRNNLGARSRIEYAPSTEHYLEDRRDGTEWKTSLPKPTWTVSRIVNVDVLSRSRQTRTFSYRHGYWDGADREFRGFGMVEKRDTETFEEYHDAGDASDRVPRDQFSPPAVERSWFHLGSVGPERGDWRELDYREEYWDGDRSDPDRPSATEDALESMSRRDRRDAIRSLRGKKLRSELYAADGSGREDRPYSVTAYGFGIRPETRASGSDDRRVFFPHRVTKRETTWERGDEPRTQFTFTRDFDAYGQPAAVLSVACPHGWSLASPSPTDGYLATVAETSYARRDDAETYLVDREARVAEYELNLAEPLTVAELREAAVDGSAPRTLVGLSRNYYDGRPFEGRPLGEVGRRGARVRTEDLILTDEILADAFPDGAASLSAAARPPYLDPTTDEWGEEYPDAFRRSVASEAGYVTDAIGDLTDTGGAERGYFSRTTLRSFDFQERAADTDAGLVHATRDELGNQTTVRSYDEYDLFPTETENPSGLVTSIEHDYNAMKPSRVIDPNGNRRERRYTPLGLVAATIVRGSPGDRVGDTPDQPTERYEYDLRAFERSPPSDPEPAYVHTAKRVRHRWEVVAAAEEERGDLSPAQTEALFEAEREDHPDRFIQERQYVDGFGRTIQTRTQAEDGVLAGRNGESPLPADVEMPPGDVVIRDSPGSGQRVRVSGWRTYDNAGNVVQAFDDFFDTGWAYLSRADAATRRPEAFDRVTETYYDPLGRTVRTVYPDGSEERIVRGDPSPDLEDPAAFEPSPWVVFEYDPTDNAGRTDPTAASGYEHRWDTPTSRRSDPLGREVETVQRNRRPRSGLETSHTFTQYDIDGNVVRIVDELDREAFRVVRDLEGRPLRSESHDAGTAVQMHDAAGKTIERRDASGSLGLSEHDEQLRAVREWARDASDQSVTLRLHTVYGEASSVPTPDAASKNLLGNVYRRYDEAGVVRLPAYDFKDRPIEKRREPLADDALVAGPVEWATSASETRSEREAALLSGRVHEHRLDHDALGRIHAQRYPTAADGTELELRRTYTPSGSLSSAELVTDPEGGASTEPFVEHIGYDERGRRALIARPTEDADSDGVLTRYAYDDQTDRVVRRRIETYTRSTDAGDSVFSPAGTVYEDVAYTYDAAGNVLEMRDTAPNSGVTRPTDPREGRDALVREFTYDARDRLIEATGRECTSIRTERPWTGTGGCGYDPDPGGRPHVSRSNAPEQTAKYTEQYHYDAAGNMTELNHTGAKSWHRYLGVSDTQPADWPPAAGSDPRGNNRLTHVGSSPQVPSQTHEYDANGNLRRSKNATYRWDYADRLRSYDLSAGGTSSVDATYVYDATGERVKKVVDKGEHRREVTEYVDGVFEFRRLETDRTATDGGTVTQYSTFHVTDGDRRLGIKRVGTPFDSDATFADGDRPATTYQMSDHLGSSTLVLDREGGWINYEEYSPFGETTFGGFASKRYRYTGKERDEESRLYYHGARYYAPWLARWTTTDPAGPRDDHNLYPYASNSPIVFSDPSGTEGKKESRTSESMSTAGGSTAGGSAAGWSKQRASQVFPTSSTGSGSSSASQVSSGTAGTSPETSAGASARSSAAAGAESSGSEGAPGGPESGGGQTGSGGESGPMCTQNACTFPDTKLGRFKKRLQAQVDAGNISGEAMRDLTQAAKMDSRVDQIEFLADEGYISQSLAGQMLMQIQTERFEARLRWKNSKTPVLVNGTNARGAPTAKTVQRRNLEEYKFRQQLKFAEYLGQNPAAAMGYALAEAKTDDPQARKTFAKLVGTTWDFASGRGETSGGMPGPEVRMYRTRAPGNRQRQLGSKNPGKGAAKRKESSRSGSTGPTQQQMREKIDFTRMRFGTEHPMLNRNVQVP